MTRHLARAGVLLTALAFVPAPTEAAFISGSIDFTGSINLVGPADVNTATGVTFVAGSTRVADATPSGSYAAVPNETPVSFTDLNPFGAPIPALWSFTVGLTNYSFDLSTLTVNQTVPDFLLLSGTGILKITGFDNTPGSFLFSSQQTVAGLRTISFSATNTAQPPPGQPVDAIPEPGSIVLLATGLVGLGSAVRRRLAHKKKMELP